MSNYKIPGIRFGPFFLDTKGRRLLREGKPVRLKPKEIKLLETLLMNRGKVLTADRLRTLVWSDDPDRTEPPAQDKNAIYVSFVRLRNALGRKYRKWIVNIPKSGYTISGDADVEEITEPSINVPQQMTSFVGREAELSKIKKLLGKTRLLTLSGPPGIGKTRLATHMAAAVSKSYQHGVCSVDLVPITDEALVAKAVATALGLTEQAGRPVAETLHEFLKDKHLLLLLDNCEHVVEACAALVERLLVPDGNLQVLTTSREALNVAEETVFMVLPLSFPDKKQTTAIEEVTSYKSVELFIRLAEQRKPTFEVTQRNVSAIAELSCQLEGIPLAIELAAAQVDAYTVGQILSMMKYRFKVLRRRERKPSRHQTLENAIDWSYELLGNKEKLLLRRLSIFTGGWSHKTANDVCFDDDAREAETLYLLAQLVRKSLIQLDEQKGDVRYRMLEMIREYGSKKLRQRGERSRLLEKHAKYFLRLAERAYEEGERGGWLEQLEIEHDNLRAALRRTIRKGGDIEVGLRMCGALSRFWFIRGHISEARRWTEKALALDDGRSRAARARALRTAGFFFGHMTDQGSDSERGRSYFEESIAIWRELGDEREKARTLTNYSFLLNRQGDFNGANETAQEALVTFRALGDHANLARAAHNLALSALDQGDFDQAIPLFEESLEASRWVEDGNLQSLCLHNLAEAAMQKGDLDIADGRLEECLALAEQLKHKPLSARSIIMQGEIAARRGNYTEALGKQRYGLSELREINDTQGIVDALEAIACTQSMLGRARLALLIYGGVVRLREESKLLLGPVRQTILDRCLNIARDALGDDKSQSAFLMGHEMALEEVVRLATEGDQEKDQ